MTASSLVLYLLMAATILAIIDLTSKTVNFKRRFITNLLWLISSFGNAIYSIQNRETFMAILWASLFAFYIHLTHKYLPLAFPDKSNENTNSNQTL